MESYAFGKRGTFVDTDEGDNSLFIAYVMGDIAVGQDTGEKLKLGCMMAHILANTLRGMIIGGLDAAEVEDNGVTARVAVTGAETEITVEGSRIVFPTSLMGQVANQIEQIVPDGKLHYLVPGQVPMMDEPDNGVVPAPPGSYPQFMPAQHSGMVVGDNYCGCTGGVSSLATCSPRCVLCLGAPSYRDEYSMFYKYGGDMPFFRKHPYSCK